MDKIQRLLNLTAVLLDARRPLSFAELRRTVYADFNSSDRSLKRMFERDKDELREMGVDIVTVDDEYGDHVGYTIPESKYYLPHLALDPEERVALTMVSRLFLGSGTPFSAPAQLAALKLAFEHQAAPEEVPHLHWVEAPGDGELLGGVLDALLRRKTVTMRYRALGAETSVLREVEPYGLFNKDGSWYFVGLCRLRDGMRCFKLDRVEGDLTVNPRNPKTPDFEVPRNFDMGEHIDWERPSDGKARMQARVVFKPRLAFAASAGRMGLIEEKKLEDGRVEARYTVNDPDEFVDWVMGFGADAVIRSPAALKEMVKARALGVLQRMEK